MLDRNRLLWTCFCLGWLIIHACGGQPVEPLPEEQGLDLSRLPLVERVEPTSAIPGSRVALHVHGQNFDEGSRVALLLSGGVIGEVQTLSTQLVTPEELVADISIADNAPVGDYSVQVTTSDGKRGIPIEDFEVLVEVQHPEVGSVTLSPDSLTVGVQETAQLNVIVRDTDGAVIPNPQVVFTVTGLKDGTVDGKGLVTGLARGSGTVWAWSGGVNSNSAVITVLSEVGSVTLSPDSLTVGVYETAQLTVIVRDTTGAVIANPDVVFSMSSWPRASNGWTLPAGTVDSTGLVTGHPGGCGDGTVIARSQGVDSNTVHITVGSPSGEGCWDY